MGFSFIRVLITLYSEKIFLGTRMNRVMSCKMVMLLLGSLLLTACGQSGALHLPGDANADKRAKYLLYSDQNTEKKAEDVHEQQAPAQ